MSVDLRELAIDRESDQPALTPRRNLWSRYVLPLALLGGFVSLLVWASWDVLLPPRRVTVIPVVSSTAEIRREGTPLFKAAGWIEPRPTAVRVAALAPGVVEELLVVEDQPVSAGQPIAELVKADAEFVLARARADQRLRTAEFNESQAALTAAETRLKYPVHLEAALGESEAALARIETLLNNLPFEARRAAAAYEAARKDYEGKLASDGVVAGVEIDIARTKMEAALALVEELRDRTASLEREKSGTTQQRNALRTQLKLLADEIKARDEAKAKRKAAEARVALADVAVAEASLQLNRMTVLAPVAGRIYRLVANQGTRVGDAGNSGGYDGSTVVTMYDPLQLQVRVDVRFEDVQKVSLEQTVEIDNPALPEPITGKVLFISSEADIQKNTLQVKVEIPTPPAVFRPEMLVDVTFLAPETKEKDTTPSQVVKLFVPKQFVQQGEAGAFVWVADQSAGVARRTRVDVGMVGNNGMAEIRSGLTIGSRIITSGADGLRDGERITVSGEDPGVGVSPGATPTTRTREMHRLPGRGTEDGSH